MGLEFSEVEVWPIKVFHKVTSYHSKLLVFSGESWLTRVLFLATKYPKPTQYKNHSHLLATEKLRSLDVLAGSGKTCMLMQV